MIVICRMALGLGCFKLNIRGNLCLCDRMMRVLTDVRFLRSEKQNQMFIEEEMIHS